MTFPSFFVVGTGRSGTTLLRTMLEGHPAVEIPGETGFLPRLLRWRRLWWSAAGLRAEVFVRLAFANGRLARTGLDPVVVSRVLTVPPCRTPQEAVSRLYACCVTSGETRLVGDKTPGYVAHLPLLAATFPEARFVQLVRHPLDVVASLQRQPWGPNDPRVAALVWQRDQARAAGSRLGPDRLRVVRLEDLVADPETVLSGVAAHLGLDLDPRMLRFQERAERAIGQNVHPTSHAGLREALHPTSTRRGELSPHEAEAAWALLADEAERLGYAGPSAASTRGTPPRLAEARVRLVAFEAGRSWRRTRTVRRLLWS